MPSSLKLIPDEPFIEVATRTSFVSGCVDPIRAKLLLQGCVPRLRLFVLSHYRLHNKNGSL